MLEDTPSEDFRDPAASFRVAITGAFLTGNPLRIGIGDYDRVRADLGQELAKLNDQGWSTSAADSHQIGTYYSGGGFTRPLPIIIARRSGEAALSRFTAILGRRPPSEHHWLHRVAPHWEIEPLSIRVDIFDFGTAVLNATFSFAIPRGLDLQDVARTIKRLVWLRPDDNGALSPLASSLRTLAFETTDQFASAISLAAPGAVQQPWLTPFLHALSPAEAIDPTRCEDWGRLLWLHPVIVVEGTDRAQFETDANELSPPFHLSIEVVDGHFAPGIGWSAITGHLAASAADIPLRILELHWAYIALYMEIDRGLLALLDQHRSHHSNSLVDLEQEADRVFSDYIRVVEARGESTAPSRASGATSRQSGTSLRR